MVNTEDFIKRLEKLLDYYGLTASSFADKVGVQRSSISHLLSGRNKPSLDFILKIMEVFPEVDFYWILNGKGNFPKNDQQANINKTLFDTDQSSDAPEVSTTENVNENVNTETPVSKSSVSSKVEKIVIFYSDGTFKEYRPE